MNEAPNTEGFSPRIAYVFIQFPKITETFNLREMLQIEKYGARLDMFSLIEPGRRAVVHPEARDLARRTRYSPWFFSKDLLRANLHYLFRSPGRYLKLLARLLSGSASQPVTLAKTLAIFPKCVFFSYEAGRLGLDHIHATFASHNATCAMVISALTGIDYSFTIDAYDLFVETALLRLKIRRARFLTTISRFNTRVISERYGQAGLKGAHVIYRGIDLDRYKPPSPPRHRAPEDPFEIVCVASLQEKKGHVFLLRALARLRDQGRRMTCVLVGNGPLRKRLESEVQGLKLGGVVTFTGDRTQEEVIARLQRADCFVLPSIITRGNRMEGIPNAMMEAMACELAVIGTSISGLPELVEPEKTGLLVPPEDDAALASALARLQDDPELGRRLGRAGREKVAEDFNLDINIMKLWRLYQTAVLDSETG